MSEHDARSTTAIAIANTPVEVVCGRTARPKINQDILGRHSSMFHPIAGAVQYQCTTLFYSTVSTPS